MTTPSDNKQSNVCHVGTMNTGVFQHDVKEVYICVQHKTHSNTVENIIYTIFKRISLSFKYT
jgi:hypothetical protein